MKKEQKPGFWQVISSIIKLISNFIKRKEQQKKEKEIAMVKQQLQLALAEGRIQDANYWNKKLAQLSAVVVLLLFLAGCSLGCSSTGTNPQPIIPQYVIIGERINKVNPGDVIKIPPLSLPAKQWYLVDDQGLYQWLDINLTATRSLNEQKGTKCPSTSDLTK